MSKFGVACYQPKTDTNVGTLFRTAFLYQASELATIGRKYKPQSSDTVHAVQHINYKFHETFDDFLAYYADYSIVAIELDENSISLHEFEHPQNCIYVLGNEGYGIHKKNLVKCNYIVQIPTNKPTSMNVAVAGSIVFYDRAMKQCTRKTHE